MNLGYHIGLQYGNYLRRRFQTKSQNQEWLYSRLPSSHIGAGCHSDSLPLTVLFFSCSRDLPEQLASLVSLLSNLGAPSKIIVASDGTHKSNERRLIEGLDCCISCVDWNDLCLHQIPSCIAKYADVHPFGKKLAILFSLSQGESTSIQNGTQLLYCDSDILFFPAAHQWFSSQQIPLAHGGYLLDYQNSFDKFLLDSVSDVRLPLNAGFLFFSRSSPPEWDQALRRLDAMQQMPGFFTEQTVMHIALSPPNYLPFPPNRFILSQIDQFNYRDIFVDRVDNIVMRHYVNPVRFKFWTHLHYSIGSW